MKSSFYAVCQVFRSFSFRGFQKKMGNLLLPSALLLTHSLLVFFAWKGICRGDSDRFRLIESDYQVKIRCKKNWIDKIKSGAVRIVPRKKTPEIASLIPGDLILFYEKRSFVYARVERIVEYHNGHTNQLPDLAKRTIPVDTRLIREQSAPEGDFLALYIDADL